MKIAVNLMSVCILQSKVKILTEKVFFQELFRIQDGQYGVMKSGGLRLSLDIYVNITWLAETETATLIIR